MSNTYIKARKNSEDLFKKVIYVIRRRIPWRLRQTRINYTIFVVKFRPLMGNLMQLDVGDWVQINLISKDMYIVIDIREI